MGSAARRSALAEVRRASTEASTSGRLRASGRPTVAAGPASKLNNPLHTICESLK